MVYAEGRDRRLGGAEVLLRVVELIGQDAAQLAEALAPQIGRHRHDVIHHAVDGRPGTVDIHRMGVRLGG